MTSLIYFSFLINTSLISDEFGWDIGRVFFNSLSEVISSSTATAVRFSTRTSEPLAKDSLTVGQLGVRRKLPDLF